MKARRSQHVAVLLPGGKVLVAGGVGPGDVALATAEIYDPAEARFTPAASMHAPRDLCSASLLRDGRVLVTGGTADERHALASAEIYDPHAGTWEKVSDMTAAREKHAATLLPDGRVLITGGSPDWQWHAVPTAEVFDPCSGRFTPVSQMEVARFKIPHATALLKNGNALVAGAGEVVEVFHAQSNRFLPVPGSLDGPHFFSSATLLGDGRVLITGGYGRPGGRANGPLSTERAWLYQP
jgi:hypothetical protein